MKKLETDFATTGIVWDGVMTGSDRFWYAVWYTALSLKARNAPRCERRAIYRDNAWVIQRQGKWRDYFAQCAIRGGHTFKH